MSISICSWRFLIKCIVKKFRLFYNKLLYAFSSFSKFWFFVTTLDNFLTFFYFIFTFFPAPFALNIFAYAAFFFFGTLIAALALMP